MPAQFVSIPTVRAAILGQGSTGPVPIAADDSGHFETKGAVEAAETGAVALTSQPAVLTVTAGELWHLRYLLANYDLGSGGTNKRLYLAIRNASDVELCRFADPTARSSGDAGDITFAPDIPHIEEFADETMVPIPSGLIVPAGFDIIIGIYAGGGSDEVGIRGGLVTKYKAA